VRIVEETDYPFGETVTFKVSAPGKIAFPLYLRVPRWSEKPELKLNGKTVRVNARPLSFIRIQREWRDGDTVTLRLPMRVSVRTWEKQKNAVSVDYGPLSFSLAIKERWEKYGDRDPRWPEWEVFPDSPWNYGLVVDARHPARSLRLERKPGPLPPQPFTPQTAPVLIKAKARKIPGWRMDERNMVEPLPQSPVASVEPVEEVTLIPMGAARLRIACFPTASAGR
jgi:hypothetical protein